METTADPLAILKTRFGYDSFRTLQAEIIGNVLARRDSLALMPTGGGKSLCYQLPALVFDGVTLVVSPLIALMKDQVDGLNANGIDARAINSSLPAREIEEAQAQVRRGRVKILYVAPERLALPGFRRFLHSVDLSLIAIDEAHCISEWGHEFRPDYRNLRQLRQEFPSVPVIALTATATERVRDDIIGQLDMQRGQVFLSSFNRANLSYAVRPKDESRGLLISLLRKWRGQSAIIYCFSRRETEELAAYLTAQGFPARPYHAGLGSEARRQTQDDFIRDRASIIVATIAFGMGIDKPDIRLVVHYSLPRSLEGYYQETGRAGRDELPSECVLFYSFADKAKQDYFINQMEDEAEQRNARQMLAKMAAFAESPTCRRRFVLEYFGEEWDEENCGACDVCLEPREQFDATEVAQKILSGVVRTGERFGANHIVQVLSGSTEKRIRELGHDKLSVYGVAKDFGRAELREMIGHLLAKGLLGRHESEYATLYVTASGREFLQQRQGLTLPRPSPAATAAPRSGSRASGRPPGPATEYDETLFAELRALRKALADARNLPPYIVFSDESLRHMAAALPQSLDGFSRVPGVGEAKLRQYGPRFVEAIRAHCEANGLRDRIGASADGEQRAVELRPRPEYRRRATEDETKSLLEQKLSVSQIAQRRNMAETTVLDHIERMSYSGESLDLEHLAPAPDALRKMRDAFQASGNTLLKPVRASLGEEFTYDELRLGRVCLQQSGQLPPRASGE